MHVYKMSEGREGPAHLRTVADGLISLFLTVQWLLFWVPEAGQLLLEEAVQYCLENR